MDISELKNLLRQAESPKLEFKRSFYAIKSEAAEYHWNELIKDVLSLANGNIHHAGRPGHLIIGAEDKQDTHGNRILISCEDILTTEKAIQERVNNCCNPPLGGLTVKQFTIKDCQIVVITVNADPYLHETTRDLITGGPKGPKYNAGTVFIRRGEQISNATEAEREAIKGAKQQASKRQSTASHTSIRKDQIRDYIDQLRMDLVQNRNNNPYIHDIREEIDLYGIYLDYLRAKERLESSPQDDRSGKRYFDYAIMLIRELIPKIEIEGRFPLQSDIIPSLISEIRDESRDSIEKAKQEGYTKPIGFLYLMKLCDIRQQIAEAFEYGIEALELDHDFAELCQFHLKICRFVYDLYEHRRDEALQCIEINKQKLCRILNVEAVDDEGKPTSRLSVDG